MITGKIFLYYYNSAVIETTDEETGKVFRKCNVSLNIEKTLKSPIYVYYKLENFYSNHREYVRSKIYPQLRGESVTDTSNCDKMKTNKDFFGKDKEMISFTGKPLKSNDLMNPCGLIARSFFNDSYKLYNSKNETIAIDESNIAYNPDKKYMFKNNEDKDKQWIDVENEHFIIWMNIELFSDFIKRWGYIDKDLDPGNYLVEIEVNWNHPDLETKKYFVLANPGKFGNKTFSGYTFIVAAALSFITVAVIFVTSCGKLKKFEPEGLTWE